MVALINIYRKRRWVTFCSVAAFIVMVCTSHPVYAKTTQPSENQVGPAAQAVMAAINEQRALSGLHPLILNPLLNQAAQAHVADMIAYNNFSHTGTDGSSVNMRVQRTGYQGHASENWVSVSEPGQAIQWWMNSWVHRNNILNGKWNDLGVGAGVHPGNGQIIFVAVFATGGGSTPAAPAPQPAVPQQPAPAPAYVASATYVVQAGDTLMDIALRHGLDWNSLAVFNGMGENDFLQIDQTIRLPGLDQSQVIQPESAPPTPVATEADTSVAEIPPVVQVVDLKTAPYTVQEGDTLVSIAAKFGTTWENLAGLNQMDSQGFLQVGQTLSVPNNDMPQVDMPQADVTQVDVTQVDVPQVSTPAPEAPPTAPVVTAANQAPPLFHVVQPGDTLISIAARYSISWETLMSVNNLTETDVIQVGQQLQLP